jgi:hypothetical protein
VRLAARPAHAGNAAGSNGLATGLAQGTTLITATLGAINSNANPATLTVAAFAYAVNFLSNNVSQFLMGTDGTLTQYSIGAVGILTQIAPAVMAGGGAWSITIDSAGHNAYVVNPPTAPAENPRSPSSRRADAA